MLASEIQIVYNGVTDITSNVLYSTARFEAQMGASPGSFELEVKDPDLSLDFVTGKTLEMFVDGVAQFGGYLFGANRTFFFPVVDTRDLAKVTRKWVLRGVDWNILFDKRVLRNPTDYLHQLDNFAGSTMDGALLREALTASKYFDVPAGFNVTTEVDDVAPPFLVGSGGEGAWPQQGSPMRELFTEFSRLTGAVFYIAPDKKFHNKALEDVEARWGFSDQPNKDVVTASPVSYQGATIGFRDGDITLDGAIVVNDAFVWGGSEFSGSGQTVFARETNAASITAHNRWQLGEAHFGEEGYKLQAGVNARADVIVNGGAVEELPGGAFNPGLRFPQWQVSLSWFSKDVPRISGVPDHLKAGDLVTFSFYAFGADELNPLILTLPLRSVQMSFVALDPSGDAHVKYTGTFGLQASDPHTLWRYLLDTRRRVVRSVAVADGASPAPYGAHFSGGPVEVPNGAITVFQLPSDYGYIGGTTEVYKTGLLMRRGIDYTETDPSAGTITFAAAPSPVDWIWIVCRLV